MEIKKSKKARLDLHSRTFYLIGLVVGLSLVLVAFEHKSYSVEKSLQLESSVPITIDEPVINTSQEKPKPKIPKINLSTIEIVINTKKIDEIDYLSAFDDTDDLLTDTFEYDEETLYVEPIYEFPEINAEFEGGDEGLQDFLAKNTHYPESAISYSAEGTVYVKFTVSSTGKVKDVKLMRNVDYYLDAEAIRVVESMPNWTPARQGTKKVATYMYLPFKFTLNR
jgi:protein TonB